MNKEQANQEAKGRLFEYLDMITTNKGNQYVCPVCKSGTGRTKTPAGYAFQRQAVLPLL